MRYKVRIQGETGLLQNCGTSGLDTRSALQIEKSSLTAKKGSNRTVVEDERIKELDCQIAVWKDENQKATIPCSAIRATIENAARKLKHGPMVREGLTVLSVEFHYDEDKYGKTLEELGKNCQHTVGVVIQRNRVLKTRALFKEWSATAIIDTDPEIVEKTNLIQWLDIAGRRIGLGDWRPQKSGTFGRFSLESIEEMD